MALSKSVAGGLLGVLAIGLPWAVCAQTAPSAEQVVNAIEGTFGVNAGQRRNHVKGSCVAGEFVGTPEAAALSQSPLFSGAVIPVVGRFSLAGGNPKVPDATRSVRGLGLQYKLPGGGLHHMAMLNVPMFGAMNPQTFLDLMLAARADPATGKPDPEKLKVFRETHPDSHAQGGYMAANNPPAAYTSASYWGIHTFLFVDKAGKQTPVRWRFVPQDGEKRLTDDEMKAAPADFLEAGLIERTGKGPVRWDMMVSIGEAGDPQDNPTLSWPDSRRQIRAGTLTLSSASPQKGAPCEAVNFDPMVMAPGIAATADPVLRFRSPSYAVSFGRRLSGQ